MSKKAEVEKVLGRKEEKLKELKATNTDKRKINKLVDEIEMLKALKREL